jgi:hypothetical protein
MSATGDSDEPGEPEDAEESADVAAATLFLAVVTYVVVLQ